MAAREEKIEAEAAALWRELYPEPPPHGDGGQMLEMTLRRLPPVDYDRLASPFLRRSALSWPKQAR